MPPFATQLFELNTHTCHLYGMDQPKIILVQPVGHDEVPALIHEAETIAGGCDKPFVLVGLEVDDWCADLLPWPVATLTKNSHAGTQAQDTLTLITDSLLPLLQNDYEVKPCVLGGYSLAGLFALWAATRTEVFAGVAAASPSVWIDGWAAYDAAHPTHARQVYLSLGDKEEHGRNKAFSRVGDNIRACHTLLEERIGSSHTILEWNQGNHFQHTTERMGRAFVWNIEELE